jgi:hypothetical protein
MMLVAGSVDALLRRRRELEAAHPQLAPFDESTLPPRDFKPGTAAEREWVRASFAVLVAFTKREISERPTGAKA